MLSRLSIIGNVGENPVVKTNSQTGEQFITFDVAVSYGKGDKKTTKWYQCSLSLHSSNAKTNPVAEYCKNYVMGGDRIFVEGMPDSYGYVNANNNLITGIKIYASNVIHVNNKVNTQKYTVGTYDGEKGESTHFDSSGFNQIY